MATYQCRKCGTKLNSVAEVAQHDGTTKCVQQAQKNRGNRGEPCEWCGGPVASDERFNMGPTVFNHRHGCPEEGGLYGR